MSDVCLGIEIGGTKLQMVAGDQSGTILERVRCDVKPSAGGEGIRRSIETRLPDLLNNRRPKAIGVGFGGPVDTVTGKICCSHQIEGWSNFPLAPWLNELSNLPVRVDNDANTAALGEATLGAGLGFDPVFYITLGSGVGGGLVAGKSIYHGALPGEAEIGHLRLDRSGATVESKCSGWAIDAIIRKSILSHPTAVLSRVVGNHRQGEARFLAEAIRMGDASAREILDDLAADLGLALSHVSHLFHPEIIVIGGGLSLMGEILREAIERAMQPLLMAAFAPGPTFRLARLGEDAVPVGALLLARRALIDCA